MSRKWHAPTALVLGGLAMAGLAGVAAGPANRPVAAAEADEPETAGEEASADDLYTRAKQAYQEGRRTQALTDAVAAHKKNPQDVRVKYLIYLLRRGTGSSDTGEATETPRLPVPGGRKAPTISEEEMQALVKEEGVKAIRGFRPIQQILQRRCATSECHGATGTGAKWVLALKGPATEQMLAENFRIVNQYMNRETPDQSDLLLKPLGGKEAGHPERAIRGKTDPIYRKILNYIGTLKTVTEKTGFWKGGEADTSP